MMDEWLRTPESDEPVPDFVERDLEEPFEIDLSDWVEVELPPDFTERVVEALAKQRAEESALEQDAAALDEKAGQANHGGGRLGPAPRPASRTGENPEEPRRPWLARARPAMRRAAARR